MMNPRLHRHQVNSNVASSVTFWYDLKKKYLRLRSRVIVHTCSDCISLIIISLYNIKIDLAWRPASTQGQKSNIHKKSTIHVRELVLVWNESIGTGHTNAETAMTYTWSFWSAEPICHNCICVTITLQCKWSDCTWVIIVSNAWHQISPPEQYFSCKWSANPKVINHLSCGNPRWGHRFQRRSRLNCALAAIYPKFYPNLYLKTENSSISASLP